MALSFFLRPVLTIRLSHYTLIMPLLPQSTQESLGNFDRKHHRTNSSMQKITPFLWFDSNAEQAMNFYTTIFKDSKVVTVARYTGAGPGPEGSVMTVAFELAGQRFIGINGGPQFKFNESVSFVVNCDTQQEIDYYWERLGEGGMPSMCGWLKDAFGLSWQIVPSGLGKLMSDPARSKNVMTAMMKMSKMDIQVLEDAYNKN
jgi:predicted 3-demethylubiquinone-9 3-methyltransferase (glyoxalase superfamily)